MQFVHGSRLLSGFPSASRCPCGQAGRANCNYESCVTCIMEPKDVSKRRTTGGLLVKSKVSGLGKVTHHLHGNVR
jgi:hypothetical protein